MLRDRLLSATILITLVVGCLVLDYHALWLPAGMWMLPLLLVFTAGTAAEMVRMIGAAGFAVRSWTAIVGAVIAVLAASFPIFWRMVVGEYPADCPVGRSGWLAIGGVAGLAIALAAEMSAYQPGTQQGLPRIVASAAVVLYVGLPLGLLAQLRQLGTNENWGLAAVVTLLAVTKAGDTGAYLVGKLIGRHKLIPKLSPGKTWEGVFGGIGLSITVSFVCLKWLFPALGVVVSEAPWWGPMVLGVACALSGMVGDLAESLFKRDAGVKDSGGLLPGMGGVWDVTDSLIGAALPGYLCFVAGVAGPFT